MATDHIRESAVVHAVSCKPTRVVLRNVSTKKSSDFKAPWRDQYVTHLETLTPDGKHDSYIWGHYFDSLIDAEVDFADRVEKLRLPASACAHRSAHWHHALQEA